MTSESKGRSPSNRQGKQGSAASRAADPVFQAEGWVLLLHPCFLDQVERLATAVEAERQKARGRAFDTTNAKLLRRIVEIAFDEVPVEPGHKDYRQGKTLGRGRSHWFRAKFGGGRFRLFFRFSSAEKIIIYAWVNDEDTLRTYGSQTDAYREFGRRLDAGRPPDSWKDLKEQAAGEEATKRARDFAKRLGRGK